MKTPQQLDALVASATAAAELFNTDPLAAVVALKRIAGQAGDLIKVASPAASAAFQAKIGDSSRITVDGARLSPYAGRTTYKYSPAVDKAAADLAHLRDQERSNGTARAEVVAGTLAFKISL